MTEYFFDWDKVVAHESKYSREITITVSGPCPVDKCKKPLVFSWTGRICPINRPPDFQPIHQCPVCGTIFDPPLLPTHPLRPRSVFLWWRMAQDQEREEIRKCMRDDWKRGARKAEKKSKKRKKKSLKKGNEERWDFC